MEEKDYGQTVTIAKKGAEKYIFAIMQSLQPLNYEKYGEIKVQCTEANLPLAEYVLAMFKSLWVEEKNREKRKIEICKDDGSSYPLEVIEITLTKHPKLRR
jgi:DNA-binding protein